MERKNIRRAALLVTTFEGIFALVFGALFIAAVASMASGAWWHIVTATVSFALCYMLALDMKRINHEEEQYECQ